MRDPYDVLGLSRTASAAEIKRAYRKLAKANHPDHNAGDPKSAERFAEVNAAYEILGDKDKREKFDRGEIDAEGKPRFAGFEGFAGGGAQNADFDPRSFSDIFSSFGRGGGGGRARSFRFSSGGRGPRATHTGGMDEEDVLNSIFGAFGGAQGAGPQAGAGRRAGASAQPPKGTDLKAEVAVTLEDLVAGKKPTVTLPDGRDVALTLPKGVKDGQVIRLRGQGYASPQGGPSGDARITVRFVPHPRFKVDGSDLRTDVAVSLEDAVLGGKATVPTIEGNVSLTVPPQTSGGRVMRLKGKGLPTSTGGRGDLLVSLRITLPETHDAELEALMKKWRATKAERKASA
ncbi:DnaJ C-terminal domain-containing protein [Afifella sp. H1R]|uniref:DnaJ C-terminal domain-containing protein n=1 Tax=unclassified Afifella TaxID=2624128 RepID=UPI001F27035D|nr:DnaJ C-terminal domain-containing protein [Afifella sp. H1R]MCF1504505.1 DnaJ domain-containing protein [Afifella sp. H1R]